ncbi:DUF1489 domain-containing protein [Novosphingobium flavum]|uniref:DUF1489 domain-containing protein n=1 Tax=Novosphingobium aerophilum TaxID=2839843 RepID=A0A7X1KBH2_9SPHN|nr:DUF1489 domain-containing protein [Novosphingobium aerophilum]MBC2651067.1 DUF1489 domain-containing protein [Novosphingobium aerophilum]MBC2662934.1 DUF1489 domain-containing protein [Novosphingobium aerophilum]
MPLHMTKVAYGAQSLAEVHGWFAQRGEVARLTTRYLPKRHAEMIGGSVFWILKHQLVARSEILGFEEAEGGRTNIVIAARLIDVRPKPRRAHQGWRYLEDADAPADLTDGEETGDILPGHIAGELARLGLV